jgi:membrane protein DedA with SNARE-associated domain
MKGLAFWAQSTVAAWGGMGLLLIAFLDCSVLSLPEAVDLLLVWLVTRNESAVAYYVTVATLGSLAGTMVLFWITRKGGEAFLRKRFAAHRVERGMALFRRYGMGIVAVSAVLPPPTPVKLFVVLAGVSGASAVRFGLAVAAGRLLRFTIIGALALWFGDEAIGYIKEHALTLGLLALAAVLAATLAYVAWRRWRRQDAGGI